MIFHLTEHRNRNVRVDTYSYSSVSNEWAEKLADCEIPETNRVRASILFPSCDRVTVVKSEDETTTKITLEHLMTTSVGGWVGPWVFNTCFKSPLIQANIHECEALRAYIDSMVEQQLS